MKVEFSKCRAMVSSRNYIKNVWSKITVAENIKEFLFDFYNSVQCALGGGDVCKQNIVRQLPCLLLVT